MMTVEFNAIASWAANELKSRQSSQVRSFQIPLTIEMKFIVLINKEIFHYYLDIK